jgi:hypothetical protein
MRRKKSGWSADGKHGIGYTTATKNVKDMLAKVGIIRDKATDKSFKTMEPLWRMSCSKVAGEQSACPFTTKSTLHDSKNA